MCCCCCFNKKQRAASRAAQTPPKHRRNGEGTRRGHFLGREFFLLEPLLSKSHNTNVFYGMRRPGLISSREVLTGRTGCSRSIRRPHCPTGWVCTASGLLGVPVCEQGDPPGKSYPHRKDPFRNTGSVPFAQSQKQTRKRRTIVHDTGDPPSSCPLKTSPFLAEVRIHTRWTESTFASLRGFRVGNSNVESPSH